MFCETSCWYPPEAPPDFPQGGGKRAERYHQRQTLVSLFPSRTRPGNDGAAGVETMEWDYRAAKVILWPRAGNRN